MRGWIERMHYWRCLAEGVYKINGRLNYKVELLWMNEWMNEWIETGMHEWMNGYRNAWMNECIVYWTWIIEWIREYRNDCMNAWMNEWIKKCSIDWTSERMSAWTDAMNWWSALFECFALHYECMSNLLSTQRKSMQQRIWMGNSFH